LFEHGTDIRYDDYKFQAALQGIDLDSVQPGDTKAAAKTKVEGEFMFKDPKEYEHLDMETRKEITAEQKARHRKIFGDMTTKRQEKAK